jgi:prepilin-type N-terminal cleavage/methylation domain-containing protein
MERQPVMSAVAVVRRRSDRPAGFTLVELLVVVVIIGMLMALVTPAVMQSLTKARNAAIKAEIDMLHMAMMNYQSEYGALPPCTEPNDKWTPSGYTLGGPSAKHLKRLFPRCANPAEQLNNTRSPANPLRLTQANALVAWLTGYTTNPTSPLVQGRDRVKLYDFDQSRIDSQTSAYHPPARKGSPYVYFDSSNYNNSDMNTFDDGVNVYRPVRQTLSTGAPEFFNSTTCQILCAGRDEQWGEDLNCDGVLDDGEDINGDGILAPGAEDDLSNFWPATRKEYLDALK